MALFRNNPFSFIMAFLIIIGFYLVIGPFVSVFLPDLKRLSVAEDDVVLGDKLYKQGKRHSSLFYYRRAVNNRPLDYVYFKIGNILAEDYRYEEAIENYEQAVKIKPDYYEAYFNMGLAYKNLNIYDFALQYLKKTIQLNPDFYLAYEEAGRVYLSVGDRELAGKFPRDAAFIMEKHNEIIDKAQSVLKEIDKDKAGDALVYYKIGLMMEEKGRIDKAVENYKKAIERLLVWEGEEGKGP